jgi:hypothetical protein
MPRVDEIVFAPIALSIAKSTGPARRTSLVWPSTNWTFEWPPLRPVSRNSEILGVLIDRKMSDLGLAGVAGVERTTAAISLGSAPRPLSCFVDNVGETRPTARDYEGNTNLWPGHVAVVLMLKCEN